MCSLRGRTRRLIESRDEITLNPLLLLKRLENLAEGLPTSVPLATPQDVLARFAHDPSIGIEVVGISPAWDLWEETLNPMLHSVLLDKDVGHLAQLIRRGPLGVDAFHKWISTCIRVLHLPFDLFEPRIKRMNDAMIIL